MYVWRSPLPARLCRSRTDFWKRGYAGLTVVAWVSHYRFVKNSEQVAINCYTEVLPPGSSSIG